MSQSVRQTVSQAVSQASRQADRQTETHSLAFFGGSYKQWGTICMYEQSVPNNPPGVRLHPGRRLLAQVDQLISFYLTLVQILQSTNF